MELGGLREEYQKGGDEARCVSIVLNGDRFPDMGRKFSYTVRFDYFRKIISSGLLWFPILDVNFFKK